MPVPSSIADLSTTPASNSPAGSETPSSVDDYLRAQAAFIKQTYNAVQDGSLAWCGTAGGTANAITLTPSPAITAYAAGLAFRFKAGTSTNTAATTIAISGLAAIALELNGAVCVGGEIVANEWYEVRLSSATKAQLIGAYVDLSRAQTIKGVKTFYNKPVFAGGLGEEVKWLSKGIGEYYTVDDSSAGVDIPPTDNPNFRYIKLTASDPYNDGVLVSESNTGSAPLLVSTAVIDFPDSPKHGETVYLENTMGTFSRAGNAGVLQNDSFQGHKVSTSGVLATTGSGAGISTGAISVGTVTITSSSPITDGTNGTPRTANETRPRNLGKTSYMRIL
jgi:hypothetical protein